MTALHATRALVMLAVYAAPAIDKRHLPVKR
jgi:hypothetical protein